MVSIVLVTQQSQVLIVLLIQALIQDATFVNLDVTFLLPFSVLFSALLCFRLPFSHLLLVDLCSALLHLLHQSSSIIH